MFGQNNDSKKNHHEISFELHIDALREQKIPWNTFVELLEEIFYSDMDKLKYLNALILTELTKSYSNMERSRYLNKILLKELKNLIQKENVDSNDSFPNDNDLNIQTIKGESLNDSEIDTPGLTENALASRNEDTSNCNEEYVLEMTENGDSNNDFYNQKNKEESTNDCEIDMSDLEENILATSNEDISNHNQEDVSKMTEEKVDFSNDHDLNVQIQSSLA